MPVELGEGEDRQPGLPREGFEGAGDIADFHGAGVAPSPRFGGADKLEIIHDDESGFRLEFGHSAADSGADGGGNGFKVVHAFVLNQEGEVLKLRDAFGEAG